jgi:hypothetical protein
VTDRRTRAAHAASQQAARLGDGVADMEKLPVAESRACQPIVRKFTAHLVDALVELAYCDHVTDPPAALTRAASVSGGLSVISSLTPDPTHASVRAISQPEMVIVPAEAYAAR